MVNEFDSNKLIEKYKSDFYIKRFNEKLDNINSFEEIPLTRKQELTTSKYFDFLAVEKSEISHYHESSGTTGKITRSCFTRKDILRGGKQIKDSGIKLKKDDVILIRFPLALFLPGYFVQEAAYQAGAAIVPVSSRNTVATYKKVIELIKELEVTIIAAIPREVELLAKTAELLGYSLEYDFPNLRGLLVAGELLSPSRINHISNKWSVPTYNMYGSTETGNVAFTCEEGTLHIAEDDYFIEVLDEGFNKNIENGKRGQAVITTISNEAQPLLRYANEDIISIHESKCKCGSTYKEIRHYGRYTEEVTIDGVKLNSYDLQEAIYSYSMIPIAWNISVYNDALVFKVDFDEESNVDVGKLAKHLYEKIGVFSIVEKCKLLNREELLSNNVSKKPVYIKRCLEDYLKKGASNYGE